MIAFTKNKLFSFFIFTFLLSGFFILFLLNTSTVCFKKEVFLQSLLNSEYYGAQTISAITKDNGIYEFFSRKDGYWFLVHTRNKKTCIEATGRSWALIVPIEIKKEFWSTF